MSVQQQTDTTTWHSYARALRSDYGFGGGLITFFCALCALGYLRALWPHLDAPASEPLTNYQMILIFVTVLLLVATGASIVLTVSAVMNAGKRYWTIKDNGIFTTHEADNRTRSVPLALLAEVELVCVTTRIIKPEPHEQPAESKTVTYGTLLLTFSHRKKPVTLSAVVNVRRLHDILMQKLPRDTYR